jgi:drug/metabolite transporter (DMT)-like permease
MANAITYNRVGDSTAPSRALLFAAFAAVYFIWGSTYLAIKYAIETLPPFLMAGSRFLVAGAILYFWARMINKEEKPRLVYWRTSVIVGTLLLLGGNGGVVLAQHYIPSSLAALLVATEPLLIVILNWLMMGGERPTWKVALGLGLGLVGVWLLVGGSFGAGSGWMQVFGAILVIGAATSWAIGSLYGLRAPVPSSPLLASGMQMLAGGAVITAVSGFTGEWSNVHYENFSTTSLLALGYLIVFGSVVAFTAYSWLLKVASPANVSTYAYVNPVVAVLLGWGLAGETLTMNMMLGASVIIGSVALITSHGKHDEH